MFLLRIFHNSSTIYHNSLSKRHHNSFKNAFSQFIEWPLKSMPISFQKVMRECFKFHFSSPPKFINHAPPQCTGEWVHWSEKVPDYFYPTDSIPEYSSILIPNVDNIRSNFLIQTIAKQKKVPLTLNYISNIIQQSISSFLKLQPFNNLILF